MDRINVGSVAKDSTFGITSRGKRSRHEVKGHNNASSTVNVYASAKFDLLNHILDKQKFYVKHFSDAWGFNRVT